MDLHNDGERARAAIDAQCNAPTTFAYTYKPLGANQLAAYDPKAPPPAAAIDVATVDGRPVPYIVREERGTSDRGVYSIAVIADPQKPFSPFGDAQPWNHKLIFIFGGGCLPGHTQGTVPATVMDVFLKFGHMVAASSVARHATSCNGVLDAEAMMMVQEHIRETYGPVRFTIADGCSGGAQAQHMVADMYPGLIDGLRPECDFPDLWTPALYEYYDSALLNRYFVETAPLLWANPVQIGAVLGGTVNPVACLKIEEVNDAASIGPASLWQPDGPGCSADGPWKYSTLTNPRGARCTLPDANVNALGRRPSDGAANRPVDHVGVQWGLQALERGEITAEQFVDLNQKVGGFDINYTWTAQHAQADLTAITNLYRTGSVVSARNWALVPEISVRADDSYDEHGNIMRDIGRSRLDKAAGNHASQVFWTDVVGPVGEGLQGTPRPLARSDGPVAHQY